MSVAIYRNRLNGEMKRFGKFAKRIIAYVDKNNSNKIQLIFDTKKTNCLLKMQQNDTLIFISHGSADSIYHKYDHSLEEKHQILINIDNANILEGKKVIAISCGTAKELGNYACTEVGCKVYFGFLHKIHFDKKNKKPVSKNYLDFVRTCYKDCFSEILEKAISESWSFTKLRLLLKLKLQQTVLTRAENIEKIKPVYYRYHGIDQAILAVSNVGAHMIIYGNENEHIN